MSEFPEFAAVIPVFQPEPGLLPLVRAVAPHFGSVVVVDDGSTEGASAFDELAGGYGVGNVVLLRHDRNRGKGAALKTALQYLRGKADFMLTLDGDGQHRLEDALAVAHKARETKGVVFGVRDFSRKAVPFRSWWGNRWTSLEVRLLFGYRLADTQTGLRAVPSRLFGPMLALPGERFEFEAQCLPLFHRLREPVVTVPIATIYCDSNRASHFRPFRDTLLTQRALFRRGNMV